MSLLYSMQFNVVLLMGFYLAFKAEINDAVIFKFTNLVCENRDESLLQVNQCRLKAVKRNHITLNFNATLLHPINYSSVQLQVFKNSNGYTLFNYNATVDVCRFMKKSYDPIAIIIFSMFKDFSNFFHPCPVEGDVVIKDFYLRSELLPFPIPTGDYLLIASWNFNKKPRMSKPQIVTKHYFAFVDDV